MPALQGFLVENVFTSQIETLYILPNNHVAADGTKHLVESLKSAAAAEHDR
jgi:hypothetical protein